MNKLEGKNYKWPGNYQTCIVPYFVYDYCSYRYVGTDSIHTWSKSSTIFHSKLKSIDI